MSTNGSPQDIDTQLAQMRSELTDTVNELAGRLDPKKLGDQAKEQAMEKVDKAKGSIMDTIQEALSGDRRAIGILAGTVLGTLGILIRLIKHR